MKGTCEVCGGMTEGDEKNGFLCSTDRCEARIEYLQIALCSRCCGTVGEPGRLYWLGGEAICLDCLADAYDHGDNAHYMHGDVVVVIPNDGSEMFAVVPVDATDDERERARIETTEGAA